MYIHVYYTYIHITTCICICKYTHIYVYIYILPPSLASFGRHYLSNTTCLIRPHVFYALFILSVKDQHNYFVHIFVTFEENMR